MVRLVRSDLQIHFSPFFFFFLHYSPCLAGFAFIHFANEEDLEQCKVYADSLRLQGRPIRVDYGNSSRPK